MANPVGRPKGQTSIIQDLLHQMRDGQVVGAGALAAKFKVTVEQVNKSLSNRRRLYGDVTQVEIGGLKYWKIVDEETPAVTDHSTQVTADTITGRDGWTATEDPTIDFEILAADLQAATDKFDAAFSAFIAGVEQIREQLAREYVARRLAEDKMERAMGALTE